MITENSDQSIMIFHRIINLFTGHELQTWQIIAV